MIRPDLKPGMFFEFAAWYYKILSRTDVRLRCQCWSKRVYYNRARCVHRNKLLLFNLEVTNSEQDIRVMPALEAMLKIGENPAEPKIQVAVKEYK